MEKSAAVVSLLYYDGQPCTSVAVQDSESLIMRALSAAAARYEVATGMQDLRALCSQA